MNIGFIGAGNMGGALAEAISLVSETKVYIYDTQEYVILNLSGVEVGGIYTVKYLPNTKLCEIIVVLFSAIKPATTLPER